MVFFPRIIWGKGDLWTMHYIYQSVGNFRKVNKQIVRNHSQFPKSALFYRNSAASLMQQFLIWSRCTQNKHHYFAVGYIFLSRDFVTFDPNEPIGIRDRIFGEGPFCIGLDFVSTVNWQSRADHIQSGNSPIIFSPPCQFFLTTSSFSLLRQLMLHHVCAYFPPLPIILLELCVICP
jgi:hypothetical protein